MIIKITFSDSHQETCLSTREASYYIGVAPNTFCMQLRLEKKKVIRKRDKAEFQIEVKDHPRLRIQKEGKEYVFSSHGEAEKYFDLSLNLISAKISKNIPTFPSKKQKCFLTITEHNLRLFPRQEEAQEKPPPG